jgi:electron transport complex protein RnfE
MVLPPGGFIVLGAWLLLFSALKRRQEARLATQGGSHGA